MSKDSPYDVEPGDRVCFNCRMLELRQERDGRVAFWCTRRHRPVDDRLLWHVCRNFAPQPEPFN